MASKLELFRASSGYFGANGAFIESLYDSYLDDPLSVPPAWRARFDQLPKEQDEIADVSHTGIQHKFARLARERNNKIDNQQTKLSIRASEKQSAVLRLISAYRVRGHQIANLDPLNLRDNPDIPDLRLDFQGLENSDLNTFFNTGSLHAPERMRLGEIIEFLQSVYTGTLGAEYMYITESEEKRWLQRRIEVYQAKPELTDQDCRHLLGLLTAAEGLEKYLHTKYVGQKRFSLEGAEGLIPVLDELITRSASKGIEEIVIGMAHRGRLNVLTNILGKPPQAIFDEFEGKTQVRDELMSSGDVKYHMGFSTDMITSKGEVHVALGFNPSHLEIIGPVIEGSVRARQQRHDDKNGEKVLAIIVHGDAAFAGQGVVMETFNISQARGYSTGGTVHIIINNQIGFTTSNPLDSRSTSRCTDVAKMVQAPILHVNGDDPESLVFATRLALDFRNRFKKDVVIDLVCYRRHGHNEADEPAVTQPEMYQKIRSHQPIRAIYAEKLIAAGIVTPEDAQEMRESYRIGLDEGHVTHSHLCRLDNPYSVDWRIYRGISWDYPAETGFSGDRLAELGQRLLQVPAELELHPRVTKIWQDRQEMNAGKIPVDWGFAENLAYASLLDQGFSIRLSGQDSRRGTFFHRHAMLRDQKTGDSYIPLQHLKEDQPHFLAIDSVLSEEAVLAFEYGYASAQPEGLTIWEAQFGDFANGAQVVIDQFITSGGAKWGLYCGLVMFLPHGYEGQGPEHSSARVERYMQMCAEHNIQVCVPTTPAQVFHMLRRQMLRPYRRPLIAMTPKSLLRHPLATSNLMALTEGKFEPVIDEIDEIDIENVNQVVLCSGKIYYELLQARRARELKHIAIVRIEQLYPFPKKRFAEVVGRYFAADVVVWCQEEPQNQGAWDQIKHRFHVLRNMNKQLFFVGRPVAAAPSTGFSKVHADQQERLINDTLNANFDPVMNRRAAP